MIGYEVIDGFGCAWRVLHNSIVAHSAPHRCQPPSMHSAKKLVADRNAYLMRWVTQFDLPRTTEWWYVIKSGDASLDALPKKTRYEVRHGRKTLEARPCSRDAILAEGYGVYVDAYSRYETFERMFSREEFAEAIRTAPNDVEFWGVFDLASGRLCAFGDNVVNEDSCFYSTMWFPPEALKKNAGYVLVQAMNEYYLSEKGLRYVSDGARNISHSTNVHRFLEAKFGFRRAYCDLKIAYATWVAIFVYLMFPVRTLWSRVLPVSRVSVLLEQERIRRSFLVAHDE